MQCDYVDEDNSEDYEQVVAQEMSMKDFIATQMVGKSAPNFQSFMSEEVGGKLEISPMQV